MKKIVLTLTLLVLLTGLYSSQTVTVRGIAKDSLGINNFISISINDTILKFRNKAFADEEFKKRIGTDMTNL